MSRVPSDPPFPRLAAYRRQRITDGARMLPVLGLVLFLLPLLWSVAEPGASTARTGLYIFGIWAGLIVVARGLAHLLMAGHPVRPDGHHPQ